MSIVCIYAKKCHDIDPRPGRTVSVDLEMTDDQMDEAVQELLDSMSPTQREASVKRLLEALSWTPNSPNSSQVSK